MSDPEEQSEAVETGPSLSNIPEQGDTDQPGPNKQSFLPFGLQQPLYFPLINGQVIRLIELTPGAWNDPVSIRLFISELQHAPEYDAISYVWGHASKTVPITCNGRSMNVTLNLNAAFKRIRLTYRSRIVWADARYCGGAEDVASLVHEISETVDKYNSVQDMPVLRAKDPLYDDPRWQAVKTLHRLPWFERAWVVQEVGIAQNPRVLYGPVEFSYRDLMKLALWTMKCAPNLDPKVGVAFFTVHTDWMDWSENWRDTAAYPGEDFIDLLNHARWLSCRDPRDHIYSLLGHPLARSDDQSGSGLIVDPDYDKDHMDVWFDLAAYLVAKHGIRLLSPVEHNDDNLSVDYPSWVPWCWTEEYTSCTLGAYYGFYYAAASDTQPSAAQKPMVDNERQLHVSGTVTDTVKEVFAFTVDDLAASPEKLRSTATSPQSGSNTNLALRFVWQRVQELAAGSETAYGTDWLDAFSLTLIAGITAYESAEKDMIQHRRDFDAYFKLWAQSVYGPESSEFATIRSTLSQWMEEGGDAPSQESEAGRLEEAGDSTNADAEKFYVDMKLMCDGRSFFVTERGYFGIGSWIAKPGDRVCVIFGGKCPFLLRKWTVGAPQEKRYKLLQDSYVHGLMRGEAMDWFKKGELVEERFLIC